MNKYLLVLSTLLVISLIIFTVPAIAATEDTLDPEKSIEMLRMQGEIIIGSVFRTIEKNSPVSADLVERGLYVPEGIENDNILSPDEIRKGLENIGILGAPIPSQKSKSPGEIKVSSIKALVEVGVYHISSEGFLEFGTGSNEYIQNRAGAYRHSGLWADTYDYKGTNNFVIIPQYIALTPGTELNAYNTHLSSASGWIEVGIGRWDTFGDALKIYTWNGYDNPDTYEFLTVPNDTSRQINFTLQISSSGWGTMYVIDTYSGNSIYTTSQGIPVTTYKADINFEQNSPNGYWTYSNPVSHHANQIQTSSYIWRYWDSKIATSTSSEAPMGAQAWSNGTYRGVDTWCYP